MLLKALSEDKSAVLVAVEARSLIREISEKLKPYPPALKHLGNALLGASLVHALSDWSDDEKIEFQWQTASGPFGSLCVDVLGTGKIRGSLGHLRPEVYDFERGLGEGLLQVRRYRSQGAVSTGLVTATGDVTHDILNYLKDSEQKPCALNLHIKIEWDEEMAQQGSDQPFKITQAVGYLIHVLPQDSDAKRDAYADLWTQRMKIMGPLSEWAIPDEPKEATKFMIDLLTVGSKPQLTPTQELKLSCTCNENRAKRALALLSSREIKSIVDENETQKIVMTCEFCGASYSVHNAGEEAG